MRPGPALPAGTPGDITLAGLAGRAL